MPPPITAEPRLLPVPCALRAPAGYVYAGKFQYTAYIHFDQHGRNDKSATVSGSIEATGSYFPLSVDFGPDVLQGGLLELAGTVPIRDAHGNIVNHMIGHFSPIPVTGANPDKAQVKARLGSLPLQVIAYKESRFRQFDDQGQPLFGPPNGFGIMQLDNSPTPTARQIWDWKANVDGGMALFAQKSKEINQHFANVYRAHPAAPHLADDQLKLSLYQYYNGGVYWSWDASAGRWTKSGPTAYADDAMRIENQVKTGSPPPGWN